jgi:hypothetical protein
MCSTVAGTKSVLVVGCKCVEAFQGGGGIEVSDFEQRGLLVRDRLEDCSRRELYS